MIIEGLRGIHEGVQGALTRPSSEVLTIPEVHEQAWEAANRLHRPGMGIRTSLEGRFHTAGFGRDTAIMVRQALSAGRAYENAGNLERSRQLFTIARDGVSFLLDTQAQVADPAIGAEPGKFIHEHRTDGYDHLVQGTPRLRPFALRDGELKLYDSVDATSLGLGAIYDYWKATGDDELIAKNMGKIALGLQWVLRNGGLDGLARYYYPRGFENGRLTHHILTDSFEAIAQPFTPKDDGEITSLQERGEMQHFDEIREVDGEWWRLPPDPIAPADVQAYSWAAMNVWGNFLGNERLRRIHGNQYRGLAEQLGHSSAQLQRVFVDKFLYHSDEGLSVAQALDGHGNPIQTRTGLAFGGVLWSSYQNPYTGETESIAGNHIGELVESSMQPDLFHDSFGFRSMSTKSQTYNPGLYHNGAHWPVMGWMATRGMGQHGYERQAAVAGTATVRPHRTRDDFHEVFTRVDREGQYHPFLDPVEGRASCANQGWTVFGILDLTAPHSARILN